jgi:hypothetical protein
LFNGIWLDWQVSWKSGIFQLWPSNLRQILRQKVAPDMADNSLATGLTGLP